MRDPQADGVLFAHGGRMGGLIRSRDWSGTELGPIEHWPRTLVTVLETILESPFPHLICWGPGLVMLYNDAYLTVLGDKPDALGRPMLEVWPEAAEFLRPSVEKALSGEAAHQRKARFVLQRGGRTEGAWFDFSYSPLRDERGRVAGILKLAVETTELEREALAREERFAKIFHAMPYLVLISTVKDGRLKEVNRAFEEVMGYSREEVLGRSSVELGLWADPKERERLKRLVLEQGRFHNQEMRVRTRGGEDKVMLVSGELVEFENEPCVLGGAQDITERLRAEAELAHQKSLLQGIFDHIPVMLVLWDPRLRRFILNRHAEEVLGWTSADANEGDFVEKVYPDADYRAKVLDYMRSLKPGWHEWEVTAKDGGKIPSDWANIRLADDTMLGIGVDLRESKRSEQALREGEERLRLFIEYAPTALAMFDTQMRYLHVSRRWRNDYNLGEKSMLGVSHYEVFPEIPPEWRDVHSRALAGEVLRSDGDRFERLDGTVQWVRWEARPWHDAAGRIGGIILYTEDITGQKRMEQEREHLLERLKESEQSHRELLENLHQVFIVKLDRDLRYIYASPPIQHVTGQPPEHFVGKRPSETVWKEKGVSALAEHAFAEVFRTGKQGSFFYSVQLPSGLRHRKVLINADKDASGRVETITGVSFDVTELEEQVRARTAELKQANQAKATFLANMSHEIRTPVGEVIGMTEMLLHRDLPEPVRRDLETIRHSTGTILMLLNDLLDLTRIEQGKLELDVRACRIREVVGSSIQQNRSRIEEKGLSFDLSFGSDVPEQIACDPDRIGQVLKNLLSNALKFTDQGSIRVDVGHEKPDGEFLRFIVSDTGIGIPGEKQGQLFQSFTQLDPSYSKRFAGAGLGLAISKQLVELMGGEIRVESEPGKGSSFSFTVRYEQASEAGADKETEALTLSDLSPKRVLLAEDNAVNRMFVSRALSRAGHVVDEARNGRQVLEMNAAQRYDLILMDIQMPELDGVEATRLIRSGGYGRADVPIVALTAYAMKGDREKFLAEGMDGYVTKPVDFADLARAMAEAGARRGD
jgi:two-component system, sensor histidine kinase and response regulator